jgi:hypothetical protein
VIEEDGNQGSVCDHLVQVYRDRVDLAEAVAVFFASGISAGESAVSVATPLHWAAIRERLQERGLDVDNLQADGRLVVADAEETLAEITENSTPALRPFTRVVGGLLDHALESSSVRRVRAFGEMVDVLCWRGDRASADLLEGLWNQLGRRREFSLLCGYKLDLFDRDVQVNLLPQIYRAHTDLLPLVGAEALDRAVEQALVEILGDEDARKVEEQVARQPTDERLSRGQQTLMWVSAHMPRAAERVLERTRDHYLPALDSAAA